ncbi:MAG: hypothetical protein HZA17_04425 [Nitrospirae bacterium]|nr:hypothetical protein [Nitrospirota bacterium]
MKKVLIIAGVISMFLFAAIAFARPWGMGMTGQNTPVTAEQQQFFEATKELRQQMHDKRFEMMELYRTQLPDTAGIAALEGEIEALRTQIQAKAKEFNIAGGPGLCGNPADCRNSDVSAGCGDCMQNRGRQGRGMGMMQGRMMGR